jgi:hypothetical protein
MILATEDGILAALAIVIAAAITVLVPLLFSGRKTRRRIGKPNGGGSVIGELEHFKGAVEERFRAGDERFDRLDRGHEELREGLDHVTNALAQNTAAIERLNDLHQQPTT